MLWDCGEGTQKQLMAAKISFMKISKIFITHWHADHWAGIISLIQTMNMEKRKEPLFVYAPEAERFISDLLDLGYWGPRFRIIPKNVPFDSAEISTILSTKQFDILSVPVNHTVPAVAYCFKEKNKCKVDIRKAESLYGLKQGPLVGKLKDSGRIVFKGKEIKLEDVGLYERGIKVVYSGDTKSCGSLAKLAENADVLIQDATFESEMENRMHSGAKEAGQLARDAKVEKLILTHFSRRYTNISPLVAEAKKVFDNVLAAEDFMRMKLKSKQQ